MTTIVNNPAPASDNYGSGFLVGVIVLVVIGLLVWFYGVPAMRGTTDKAPVPQINVPSQIDVNVNQPK